MSNSPAAHAPHGTGSGRRTTPTTRSPAAKPLAAGASSTRPSDSWPSTNRSRPGAPTRSRLRRSRGRWRRSRSPHREPAAVRGQAGDPVAPRRPPCPGVLGWWSGPSRNPPLTGQRTSAGRCRDHRPFASSVRRPRGRLAGCDGADRRSRPASATLLPTYAPVQRLRWSCVPQFAETRRVVLARTPLASSLTAVRLTSWFPTTSPRGRASECGVTTERLDPAHRRDVPPRLRCRA